MSRLRDYEGDRDRAQDRIRDSPKYSRILLLALSTIVNHILQCLNLIAGVVRNVEGSDSGQRRAR